MEANSHDVLPHPTHYWHRYDSTRVQCDLCPRACRMHEGQRGLCYVRGVEQGKVVLHSYGRSSGFCIDPIEKKPLNHFLPGSPVLSFGTAGCNLACKFCQNWDISKSRQMDTLQQNATPAMIAHAAKDAGARSVAFTYNDPVIFHEYAIDTAVACHELGVKSVAVTAGYVCEAPRQAFYRHMDAVNVDLKAFSDRFYKHLCGAELDAVLDTLCYIHQETAAWLEVTTLLIPGENDSSAELERQICWFYDHLGPDVPLHFSAFHLDFKMRHVPATTKATLTRAREMALAAGLKYVYTGNVRDVDGGSTWCHHCGDLLIERDGYQLGQWYLTASGHCRGCGTGVAGVFDSQPGNWGARRQPVDIKKYTGAN
ncbi:Uncharacterised protein [BD1-7 clade bacterium]|uniref:Radical SAM core domain-containing protein n=1 Tax=BD1-7 clade bacterium TaxID=2029982 RepID=A0A5S9MUJ4_9GAMM|nr:Uncharacterised protein [BD1-7 clade bacterium]CAA0083653.1 Uncharacterised protein [BD1-7 clade bacterium]